MIKVIAVVFLSHHHHRIHHAFLAHHLSLHSRHHHHARALELLRTTSKRIILVIRVEIWAHITSSVTTAHNHVWIHHFLAELWGEVFVKAHEICILIHLLILLFLCEERIVCSTPTTTFSTTSTPYHSGRIKAIEVGVIIVIIVE